MRPEDPPDLNAAPMRKVIYLGEIGYTGHDSTTGERFRVGPGVTIVVSTEKAEQLLRDFPGQWKDRGKFTLRPVRRAANVTYPVNVSHTT